MEIKDMNALELDERKAQLDEEIKSADAERLDAISAEIDAIVSRKAELKNEAEERAKVVEEVMKAPEPTPIIEERKTEKMETRNTQEYINAFANYIKTGDDREARALLTENVSGGTLPVPEFVDDIIRTAWENDKILSRVKKTYIRGNLKVAFEISADEAYEHTEGTTAVTEESLTLGIVNMIPKNIKKWITISDEAVAMGGEAFLRYVYNELTHRIIKKVRDLVITDIKSLPATSATAPSAPVITEAPALDTVAKALSNLSDEATDNVVIMNRLTWGAFKAAQAAGHFAYDPFEGLEVLYTSALPAYSTAASGAVYAIVGDLDGAQVNYPEGDDVVIKWDELTLAEKDMVKVVGRQYAAHAVTANGRFCNIAKPAPATT